MVTGTKHFPSQFHFRCKLSGGGASYQNVFGIYIYQKSKKCVLSETNRKISDFTGGSGRYACTESHVGKNTSEMDELDRGGNSLKT